MYNYRAILIVFTAYVTVVHSQPPGSKAEDKTLFSHKKNSRLYWEALRYVANGNKEAALKIVETLNHDISADFQFAWEEDQPSSIDLFFDKLFLASVERDPEELSWLGLLESIGIRDHKAQLTDISLEHLLQEIKDKKENLRRLQNYKLDGLSRDQKISHKVATWKLEQGVAEEKFLFHRYIINQMECFIHILTYVFTQFHALEVPEDVEHYITRLGKIPQKFQQAVAFVATQQEKGILSSSFSKLGHLRDELLRAARLVVDTGIHHKRWSCEQAIEYMEEVTAFHHNQVVSEVERYFVWPGQACAYKIGQLKILELRRRAQDKLGEQFSIQEFHDVVLKVATVPLAILEEVVEEYIQDKLNVLPVQKPCELYYDR